MFFKKNQPKGMGYPVCDYLNNALRRLLDEPFKNDYVISEICYAIEKSGGYFKDDVKELISYWKENSKYYKLALQCTLCGKWFLSNGIEPLCPTCQFRLKELGIDIQNLQGALTRRDHVETIL